jgi:GT2 family glycosyltransferase
VARIGVVTVTYNSGSVLRPFLQCCLAQSHRDFILYVVDNASSDDTLALLRDFEVSRIRLVANATNLGVAEGNNQGIRLALEDGCTEVLLLNNDTEFEPTLFEQLSASLARTSAAAVTPRILFFDSRDDWFANGGFTPLWGGVTGRHLPRALGDGGQAQPIDYAPTCCMLVRREVFDQIGLMDERYFVYWDDTDFCWRLRAAGLLLFVVPDVVLLHKVSSLTGGLSSDFFIRHHYRNQIYFVRKHFGAAASAYTAALLFATILLRVPLRGDPLRQCRLRIRSLISGFRIPLESRP